MKLFSTRTRPPHLGPWPLEDLARAERLVGLEELPPQPGLSFSNADPLSIIGAMGEYQAMLDATREGMVKRERAIIPEDPAERARHLKGFGYFCDAAMVGICAIPAAAWRDAPLENPDVSRLAETLKSRHTNALASGVDVIMASLRESLEAPPEACRDHTHALVFLYDYPRDPAPDEPGAAWIAGAQAHRAALRAAETATTLAHYIRLLGWRARAHSAAASDVHLERLAVAAGLARVVDEAAENPFVGRRFGLAAVTTTLEVLPDKPLSTQANPRITARLKRPRDPYARRRYAQGPHPFERLKRTQEPTTYIDKPNVARVPKRANMFVRALFGDMGRKNQEAAKNGNYVRKSAVSFAFRPTLGALILLQDGETAAPHPSTTDPARNAEAVKAAAYFLGCDAVGISACPDWAWYSHDASGKPITPYHENAISIIIDQGFDTMEGASGDDWIAAAQSMRAYLRFSLLGGVLAQHIRNLGHSARTHTVMDDEVLHPPLLLLSGLGEVSRIGEVILNPYLGPRLKSGVITTNMPLAHDRPIDFGLQRFCEACNKCARECPSGAITAGPKRMFNGYEIWKSDSQKCLTYRIGQEGGAMCGRCMKTCPWNLEGLFAEAPFRWLASHAPSLTRPLARLDDALGRGEINPVKTWWWDLEMRDEGPYGPPARPVNRRGLNRALELRPEDQTLAVYPANLAPPPWLWPAPADREAGIAAFRALIGAEEHKARRARGLPPEHVYTADRAAPPVIELEVARAEALSADTMLYELVRPSGGPLPGFEPGAHVEVLVAPEFIRAFSLVGPVSEAAPERYLIAVKREEAGRGGSRLMHRAFRPGRRVTIAPPVNHFPLDERAPMSFLMGGGIGITPLIAMAERLHARGRPFALHYSVHERAEAALWPMVAAAPWAGRAHLHVSAEGSRAAFAEILAAPPSGAQVYACGSEGYMQAVLAAAHEAGLGEDACHIERFAPPEDPDEVNHPFVLRLARSGREITVPAEMSAADALAEAGVPVPIKCADGLCGVCKARVVSGEVEHRDHVLSQAERAHEMILCRSRAARPGETLEIDL